MNNSKTTRTLKRQDTFSTWYLGMHATPGTFQGDVSRSSRPSHTGSQYTTGFFRKNGMSIATDEDSTISMSSPGPKERRGGERNLKSQLDTFSKRSA